MIKNDENIFKNTLNEQTSYKMHKVTEMSPDDAGDESDKHL